MNSSRYSLRYSQLAEKMYEYKFCNKVRECLNELKIGNSRGFDRIPLHILKDGGYETTL
jgi:hypothetical protein